MAKIDELKDDEVFLTEEEREALGMEEGGEPGAAAAANVDVVGDGEGEEDAAAIAAEAAAAAVAADPAAATPTEAPTAAPTAAPQAAAPAAAPAPVLVAEAPADADAKLGDIAKQKDELVTKFDDGDITSKEYQSQLDALNKQERDIERQVDKAQIAAEMQEQQRKNEWIAEANRFAEENGYSTSPRLYKMLDMEVRDVATSEEGKTMTGTQILAKAHANLVADGIAKAKPAPAATAPTATAAPVPKPALPPNLAKIPAAAATEAGEGRFVALDRLQTSNPLAYEEAIAKLSPAELDAYMRATA